MADKREVASGKEKAEHWDATDQSLLSATLMATPTQRIAWLEEALQLAYATGALKPRRFITKEEWDARDHRIRDRLSHRRRAQNGGRDR